MKKGRGRGWSYDDIVAAQALVARGATDEECMAAVGRDFKRCADKVRRWGLNPQPKRKFRMARPDLHVKPAEHLIHEAVRRMSTPKSLTAWVCGDPPPGFSALERRP